MADFDLEQLKTLFENLGDRLEKTKGDQLSRDELYRIRTVLNKMSNQTAKAGSAPKKDGVSEADVKKFISEAVKEIGKVKPKGTILREPNEARRGTIIREEQARQKGDPSKNTILDQLLQNAGKEANEFGAALDKSETKVKSFGERVTGATAAFGTVATAASAFVGKMLGAGAERVDQYRALLASGEGTVSSMQDMGRQAANAGMTVEQFVKAMTEGTQGARQLGAIKFGDVRKSVNELSKASGYMGMLPDQITEVTSTYAEILRLQGAGQNRSSESMAAGIMNLVKTSETTAHILGLSREDALKAQAELAKNAQLNAVMQAKGIDPETARALVEQVTAVSGNSGRDRLLDQLTFGQAGPDSAQFQAINAPMANAIANIGDKLNAGARGEELLVDAARGLQTAGKQRSDSETLAYAQLGRLNAGGNGQIFTDSLMGDQLSRGLNTDKNFNRATNQNQNEEQRAGVGALQVADAAQRWQVAADAAITAVFNPMVDTYGPVLRDTLIPASNELAASMTRAALEASTHTTTMASLGTIALAVAGGLTLFTGALSIASKGLGLLNSARAGVSALGGGGAAAGAGGAGAGAARTALGVGARVAGGVVGGGLLAYEGGKMVQDRKNESFLGTGKNEKGFFGSRSNGYAASAGGGALAGAAIGSVIPVVGTAAGAAIGGLAGLGYAWWNDDGTGGQPAQPQAGQQRRGPNTASNQAPRMPGNATQAPQNARTGSRTPQAQSRTPPANATGQKGRATLSADQMSQKIMEANDRSANYLKSLKENSDKQLEATREEIAVMRNMSDRVSRLLEEGNRNTKSVADHSL